MDGKADIFKHLRGKYRIVSLYLWGREEFLKQNTHKILSKTEKIDKLDSTKIRDFCSSKDLTKEFADKPQTKSRYLQHI